MDQGAIFAKTAKGIEEIQSRTYRLPPRPRALLIMVDGKASVAEIVAKGAAAGNPDAAAALADLEAKGFIASASTAAGPGAQAQAAATTDPASLEAARRFGIDQVIAMMGPLGDDYTRGLESARDRAALMAQLERCRNAIAGAAGAQKAARFWSGIEERLGIKAAAAAAAGGAPERSLASVRRFALEQMKFLPAPHGPAFAERLQSSADRATLMSILERCRNGFQILVSDEAAERFWAGVEQRLP